MAEAKCLTTERVPFEEHTVWGHIHFCSRSIKERHLLFCQKAMFEARKCERATTISHWSPLNSKQEKESRMLE